MIAAALIEAGQYDPGPSPPDEVLSSYTYGIPFIKLVGTTDEAFLDHRFT